MGGGAAGAAGRPDVILVITRRIWGNLRPDNNWDCHNRMIPPPPPPAPTKGNYKCS